MYSPCFSKVSITPLHFYKRPTLVHAFSNWKIWRGFSLLWKKGKRRKQLSAFALQRVILEAAGAEQRVALLLLHVGIIIGYLVWFVAYILSVGMLKNFPYTLMVVASLLYGILTYERFCKNAFSFGYQKNLYIFLEDKNYYEFMLILPTKFKITELLKSLVLYLYISPLSWKNLGLKW